MIHCNKAVLWKQILNSSGNSGLKTRNRLRGTNSAYPSKPAVPFPRLILMLITTGK